MMYTQHLLLMWIAKSMSSSGTQQENTELLVLGGPGVKGTKLKLWDAKAAGSFYAS